MKCKQCGSNLNIEDKFCPYCGTPNPFAVQHQREMEAFTKEFNDTKDEVIKTTGAKGKRAGRMTVLAVLALLVAIMFILVIRADEIRYWREEKKIDSKKAEYTQEIEQYMANGDYLGLSHYTNEKRLKWSSTFDEYDKVFYGAQYYERTYSYCVQLMQFDYQSYSYGSKTELLEYTSENLYRLFENAKEDEYDSKRHYFDGNRRAFIDGSVEQGKLLAKTFFGLSDEEVAELPNMTEARITVLLEDSYEKKTQK